MLPLLTLLALIVGAVPTLADSTVHELPTATTVPVPAGSCMYVDQGPGTDSALCPSSINPGFGQAFGTLPTATTTKTTNYVVLSSDNGTTFDNTGASGEVDFTLPAEADNMNYGFCVVAAQTLKVIAPASTKIAVGASNSLTAGNITANVLGACVWLYSPKGATGQWIAKSSTGTWTVN